MIRICKSNIPQLKIISSSFLEGKFRYFYLPFSIRSKLKTASETVVYCTLLRIGSIVESDTYIIPLDILNNLIPEIKTNKQISRILNNLEEYKLITTKTTRDGKEIKLLDKKDYKIFKSLREF